MANNPYAAQNTEVPGDIFEDLPSIPDEITVDANSLRTFRLNDPILEYMGLAFLNFPGEIPSHELIREWNGYATLFSERPLAEESYRSFYDFTLFVLEGSCLVSQEKLEIGASDFKIYSRNLADFVRDSFVLETFEEGQKGIVDAIAFAMSGPQARDIPRELKDLALSPAMIHRYPSLWDHATEDKLISAVEYQVGSDIPDCGLIDFVLDSFTVPTIDSIVFMLDLADSERQSGGVPTGVLERALMMIESPLCDPDIRISFEGEVRLSLSRCYMIDGSFEKVGEVVDGAFFGDNSAESLLTPIAQVELKCLKGESLLALGEATVATSVFQRAVEIAEEQGLASTNIGDLYQTAICGLVDAVLAEDKDGRGIEGILTSAFKVLPERDIAPTRVMIAESLFRNGFLRAAEDLLKGDSEFGKTYLTPDQELKGYVILDVASRMSHAVMSEIPEERNYRESAMEVYRKYETVSPSEMLIWLLPDFEENEFFSFDWCDEVETYSIVQDAERWYQLREFAEPD